MFAIIRAGGKQLRVSPGDTVRLERFSAEPGAAFETDQVLVVGEDDELKIGRPLVEGAKVLGTVVAQSKDRKILVFKRKRRKTYRRKQGHRQQQTVVKIDQIST